MSTKKRDTQHYLDMFRAAGNVGINLVADGVHVARGGEGRASADLVRALKRLHGDDLSGQAAAALVADEASPAEPGQTFAARLRARREELGLTRGDLAALSGVSESTVESVEIGRRGASLESASALASALGTTVDALAH